MGGGPGMIEGTPRSVSGEDEGGATLATLGCRRRFSSIAGSNSPESSYECSPLSTERPSGARDPSGASEFVFPRVSGMGMSLLPFGGTGVGTRGGGGNCGTSPQGDVLVALLDEVDGARIAGAGAAR